MVNQNLTIENARIMFRNFSGEEGKYNRKGDRNFCVLLENTVAGQLALDGWNIRYLKPRDNDPDDLPQAYMPVKVSFENFPPQVYLITSKSKTQLDEDNISTLDWAEIERCDLIIRPYNWEVNGKTGVKAYLKTGYFTIAEDAFADRYSDIPYGD